MAATKRSTPAAAAAASPRHWLKLGMRLAQQFFAKAAIACRTRADHALALMLKATGEGR